MVQNRLSYFLSSGVKISCNNAFFKWDSDYMHDYYCEMRPSSLALKVSRRKSSFQTLDAYNLHFKFWVEAQIGEGFKQLESMLKPKEFLVERFCYVTFKQGIIYMKQPWNLERYINMERLKEIEEPR